MADETASANPRRARALALLAAKLAVVVALIWVAVRGISVDALVSALARTSASSVLLAVLIQCAAILAAAYRWHLCLAALGMVGSIGRTVQVYLISNFLGTALPAGIGQDVIRIYAMARDGEGDARRLARATASVLLDRIAGLAAFALLGLPAIVAFYARDPAITAGCVGLPAGWLPSARTLLVGAMLLAVGGILAASSRWSRGRWPAVRETASIILDQWSRLLAIAVLSALIVLLVSLVVVALGWSLTPAVPLTEYLLLVPLIAFLAQLPISILGLGVREVGFVALFACATAARADVLALSLVYFAVGLVANLMGGLALLRAGESPRRRPY